MESKEPTPILHKLSAFKPKFCKPTLPSLNNTNFESVSSKQPLDHTPLQPFYDMPPELLTNEFQLDAADSAAETPQLRVTKPQTYGRNVPILKKSSADLKNYLSESNFASDEGYDSRETEPPTRKKIKPNFDHCRTRINPAVRQDSKMDEEKSETTFPRKNTPAFVSPLLSFCQPQKNLKRNESIEVESDGYTTCANFFTSTEDSPKFSAKGDCKFFLSPMLLAKRTESESTAASETRDTNMIINEKECDEMNEELDSILTKRNGTKQRNLRILTPTAPFSVKCYFKHSWVTSLVELREKWCMKCETSLEKCRSVAASLGGRVLNETYGPLLMFKCRYDHQWSHGHKNWEKTWCQSCAKDYRKERKRIIQEEEEKRQEELKHKQNELFEEAKRKMYQEEESKERREYNPNSLKIIEAYKNMDMEIEKLAMTQAEEFMKKKNLSEKSTLSQVLTVYKMILLPEEFLRMYLSVLKEDSLKSEFRKWAKLVHPDKNFHPKAAMAFQKIYKIYNLCLNNLSD